jgi:predicted Fe-Mo cluster-binding NifX family protein
MSKVVVMMSEDRVDAPVSAHFGKAEWALIADTQCHRFTFFKNDDAHCKSTVERIAALDCTDAIFTEIGAGALTRLQACHIRGWFAPSHVTGGQALEMFEHLRLQPAQVATGSQRRSCCSQSATPEPSGCCNR